MGRDVINESTISSTISVVVSVGGVSVGVSVGVGSALKKVNILYLMNCFLCERNVNCHANGHKILSHAHEKHILYEF